ncbi:MAG: RhuM family protein [Bifidobacterium sp.]
MKEELTGFSVVAKFATTASDGKRCQVRALQPGYDPVGRYRVKSKGRHLFRRWANSVLKQHLVDGYTINRKRLDALHAVVRCYRGPPNWKLLAPPRSWNDICRVLCC